jgi:hypothetical protein
MDVIEAIGGGFPAMLFRLRGGVTVPPWPRFQFPPRQTEHANFRTLLSCLLRPEGYETYRTDCAFGVKLGRRTW